MVPAGTQYDQGWGWAWRGRKGHIKRQDRQVREPTRNEGSEMPELSSRAPLPPHPMMPQPHQCV